MGSKQSLKIKRILITDDYRITDEVIGYSKSGAVVKCVRKSDNKKFALKILTYIVSM